MTPSLSVRVARVETITPRVKQFTLVPEAGVQLPRFSAGSHVLTYIPGVAHAHRNPYSLIGDPAVSDSYKIAVLRAEPSRGGSAFLHDHARPGDVLEIGRPLNLFPLDRVARRHVLVAGGIGITPFMAYLAELLSMGAAFELHYAFRDREEGAFLEELERLAARRLRLYDAAAGERIHPSTLLSGQPLGTHAYVCGPSSLIDSVREAACELGWPNSHLHWEQFAPQPRGRPLAVRLARSGRELRVGPDESILEALEASGVAVPHLCRMGLCGHCETRLLDGQAEHRDNYLSDADKASQQKIMPCVSRARGQRLVLDL